MNFDYYAELAATSAIPIDLKSSAGLVSGFSDECIVCADRGDDKKGKNKVRNYYRKQVRRLPNLQLPGELKLNPRLSSLPDKNWIGFEIGFVLQRPCYSKDDRPLHLFDNPLRKDRVFGVPYMSGTSWKGLLRWACRMHSGLFEYLESHNGKMEDWHDYPWIVHLFGNEKGNKSNLQQGALVFYPTWFERIDFEVINPHIRVTRAGETPIYYEVIPPRSNGVIRLLYAAIPGAAEHDRVNSGEALCNLLDAIEMLLVSYGISAKRTAGWGTANIEGWKAFRRDQMPIEKISLSEFKDAVKSLLTKEVKLP